MQHPLNQSLVSMPESLTLKITGRAKALKKEGVHVIDFGVGEPDFDTPSSIKQAAIKAIQEGKTKYTPATGLPELKEAVINKLRRDNQLEYELPNISINCGAKHTLFNIFMALLNPDDEVLIGTPYWLSYPAQVEICGGKPVFMETTLKSNFKVTPDHIEKHKTPRTKAFVLNSPCNPSGMVYTNSEMKELAQYLDNQDLWIISDEVYEYLIYDENSHYSLARYSSSLKEKTIVVNAVSKTYAMTGWRIGYCAGSSEVIKVINTIQSHSTSNPSTPSQYAAIAALENSIDDVEKMVKTYDRRRKLMYDLLKKVPGVSMRPPEGAFYAFPDCSEMIRRKGMKDSVEMCKDLLEKYQVAAIPGSAFGVPGCIRLSYALDDDSIIEGIKRLHTYASHEG